MSTVCESGLRSVDPDRHSPQPARHRASRRLYTNVGATLQRSILRFSPAIETLIHTVSPTVMRFFLERH